MKLFLNILVVLVVNYLLHRLFLYLAPIEHIYFTIVACMFADLFITAGFWLEFNNTEESIDYSNTYNPRGNPKDDHTNY